MPKHKIINIPEKSLKNAHNVIWPDCPARTLEPEGLPLPLKLLLISASNIQREFGLNHVKYSQIPGRKWIMLRVRWLTTCTGMRLIYQYLYQNIEQYSQWRIWMHNSQVTRRLSSVIMYIVCIPNKHKIIN